MKIAPERKKYPATVGIDGIMMGADLDLVPLEESLAFFSHQIYAQILPSESKPISW
jgi:hypothetical protein